MATEEKKEEPKEAESPAPEPEQPKEPELPTQPEQPYIAEISLTEMTLKHGDASLNIPRNYFRAVYDAMNAAIVLKPGDSKAVVLVEKKSQGSPSSSKYAPGSPEWYKNVVGW